jgi:hypothetical protein
LGTVNISRACLAATAALSLLALPLVAASAQDDLDVAEPLPERVLFIGNSHTARHGGLDWVIGNMVAADEPEQPFEGRAETEGGVTLEYHWQNGAVENIRTGDFDVVVLQGYLPGSTTGTAESFIEHARRFDTLIRESGAETVFFMTWPRDRGDWSNIDDVVEAHRLVAAELDARVAPAALAFEKARAERPDLALIDDDQVHATWDGAYLAAATVYGTLFERSPEGLTYHFGVTADNAAFLQRIARETIDEWRAGEPAA